MRNPQGQNRRQRILKNTKKSLESIRIALLQKWLPKHEPVKHQGSVRSLLHCLYINFVNLYSEVSNPQNMPRHLNIMKEGMLPNWVCTFEKKFDVQKRLNG